MSAPILELLDVDVPRAETVSTVPVVRDVSWRICQGEFWAVGALPGQGKTDLLCSLGGLQRPMKGSYFLFGRDSARMNEEEFVHARLQIGMVFNSGRLFAHLTLAENVALPLRYHFGSARDTIPETVARAIDLVGLTDYASSRPVHIPRNLHQRAGLARALVLRPEMLLIDNPLAGADARQARWWLDFLCLLSKGHEKLEGKPVTNVVATADLGAWADTATRFAMLKDRRLEILGGREDLKKNSDALVQEMLLPSDD